MNRVSANGRKGIGDENGEGDPFSRVVVVATCTRHLSSPPGPQSYLYSFLQSGITRLSPACERERERGRERDADPTREREEEEGGGKEERYEFTNASAIHRHM